MRANDLGESCSLPVVGMKATSPTVHTYPNTNSPMLLDSLTLLS